VIHQPGDLGDLPEIGGRIFIIGGSEIYSAFLEQLEDLLVTHVFTNHAGDTYFPEFQLQFPNSEVLEKHADFEVVRHFR
jgi:dihydrofolate reductase